MSGTVESFSRPRLPHQQTTILPSRKHPRSPPVEPKDCRSVCDLSSSFVVEDGDCEDDEDKNKNEEEKEINDEDGDDEETENDKEDEEEGEKESEEGDEEDGDENKSDEGDDTESEEGDEDVVKTFNIDKFQVEMPIDDPTNLTGDFVVKSAMGAKFDPFRTILMNEKLEDFFKSSYFGYFLDLPEANNARFQMSMVYDLLKRRIKYKGDDSYTLEDKNKKMDEI
ncbi:hypothetical protein H5410_037255 [Solanum commersonii]|uniref:Uncharacterized protein n=1 Tax=Solanum commersonii TaxID=4109 RepID=A0A9J5Y7Y8_SOLCO|nr:hypothetical protein H5410_037255 [Solanum commersonii]